MKDLTGNSITIYEDKLDLREIISNSDLDHYEEALFACDLSDIIEKYKVWKESLPRVTPFYAVKCNDHPTILQLLASLGTGFDCASKGEIAKVLGLGVDPSKIIFANPTKPKSHLIYSYSKGINVMTFDSEFELIKVQKTFPQASLVLRIRCDAEKAQCLLGEKYGCDPEKDAPRLISLARDMDLQLIGISFHVGSGCMDFPVYQKAIIAARRLFDYAKTVGYDFDLLDIGGGFPGDKGTYASILEVATIINESIEKYFPENYIKIISEPGRFFVSSAFTLICKIHSKKEVVEKDNVVKMMYYINDGVYGSFNCILYDHKLAQPVYITETEGIFFKSSIWGPTCDALDQVCENVLLPKLSIGDILIFENMGAYTLPIASPFNGFPLPRLKFYLNSKDEQFL